LILEPDLNYPPSTTARHRCNPLAVPVVRSRGHTLVVSLSWSQVWVLDASSDCFRRLGKIVGEWVGPGCVRYYTQRQLAVRVAIGRLAVAELKRRGAVPLAAIPTSDGGRQFFQGVEQHEPDIISLLGMHIAHLVKCSIRNGIFDPVTATITAKQLAKALAFCDMLVGAQPELRARLQQAWRRGGLPALDAALHDEKLFTTVEAHARKLYDLYRESASCKTVKEGKAPTCDDDRSRIKPHLPAQWYRRWQPS
jgi:hypothetical protein